MEKTRILGIAPYEGMRTLMVQLAAQMEDVQLTAYVGDLNVGADIVARQAPDQYDVILSRGGTAELIRAATSLPVVDIELSLYDLLRAMHLAETSNSDCALVGFPAITRNATFLCDVLNYRIELNTIHDEAEARTALSRLAREGCRMVLCDMITHSIAHEYGIPAVLIASGSESVEAAIRQAVSINRSFRPLRDQAHLMEAVLKTDRDMRIILSEQGACLFRTGIEPDSELEGRCHRWLPQVLRDGTHRFAASMGGRQYQITGRSVVVDGRMCVSYSFRASSLKLNLEKYGIRHLDREEAEDLFFNSFFGATQSGYVQLYEEYAKSATPTVIVGDLGTGKLQMVQLLYSRGKYQNAPLCAIDCTLLQDKGWSYLMESDASPLAGEGHAVYFEHVDALPEGRFQELFALLRDLRFQERNQMLFTAHAEGNGTMPAWVSKVLSWFDCTLLQMPLLMDHKEDIPHLAALYISTLNANNAREIAGIDSEALQLLQAYDWPGNYDQFKRVLRRLVMETAGVSVRAELVQRALRTEELLYPAESSLGFAEAVRGRTMDEVDLMLVRQALVDAGGSRTAAAARLGISRSSLWRMIQRMEEASLTPPKPHD